MESGASGDAPGTVFERKKLLVTSGGLINTHTAEAGALACVLCADV